MLVVVCDPSTEYVCVGCHRVLSSTEYVVSCCRLRSIDGVRCVGCHRVLSSTEYVVSCCRLLSIYGVLLCELLSCAIVNGVRCVSCHPCDPSTDYVAWVAIVCFHTLS